MKRSDMERRSSYSTKSPCTRRAAVRCFLSIRCTGVMSLTSVSNLSRETR